MKTTAKFLAYVLRHNPSAANITLDQNGWADVAELIDGACAVGRKLDIASLEDIVATDGKQRFSFNCDRTKIRANQGHSVAVDVQMVELEPPSVLYHGTAEKYVTSIKERGICKQSRNYVHLSIDTETAFKVGSRHGKAVIFAVNARQMYADGYRFLLSANGVWQTEYVPIKYITQIL